MVGYTYSAEIKAAQEGIAEFGVAAVLQRTADTVTLYPCIVLIAAYNAIERANSFIQYADRKMFVAAADFPIVPDVETDRLIVGDQTFRLVTVTPLAPGGINILFELQARL